MVEVPGEHRFENWTKKNETKTSVTLLSVVNLHA